MNRKKSRKGQRLGIGIGTALVSSFVVTLATAQPSVPNSSNVESGSVVSAQAATANSVTPPSTGNVIGATTDVSGAVGATVEPKPGEATVASAAEPSQSASRTIANEAASATPKPLPIVSPAVSANSSSQPMVSPIRRASMESQVSSRTRKTRYPLALFIDVSPVWQTSRGYDLFADNDLSTRYGVTAEVDLIEFGRQTILSVDANGFGETASDNVLSGQLKTEYSAWSSELGFRLRKEFWQVFSVHAIAMGGTSRITTKFDDGVATSCWVPVGHLGGGVSASLPGPMVIRPGLLLEGGYFVSGSADLKLKQDAGNGTLRQMEATLGDLSRSGPYVRVSVFARF